MDILDILVQPEVACQQGIKIGGSLVFDTPSELPYVNQVLGQHSGMPTILPRAPAKVLRAVKNSIQIERLIDPQLPGQRVRIHLQLRIQGYHQPYPEHSQSRSNAWSIPRIKGINGTPSISIHFPQHASSTTSRPCTSTAPAQ